MIKSPGMNLILRLGLTLSLFPIFILSAWAKPKIASVDFTKVVSASQEAEKISEKLAQETKNLKNHRFYQLSEEHKKKWQSLSEQLANQDLGKAAKEKLNLEYLQALQDHQKSLRAWKIANQKQLKILNQQYVHTSRENFNQISETISSLSASLGYDWVVETSGHTNTKLPLVLYLKESTDITDLVIKEINPPAPEKPE